MFEGTLSDVLTHFFFFFFFFHGRRQYRDEERHGNEFIVDPQCIIDLLPANPKPSSDLISQMKRIGNIESKGPVLVYEMGKMQQNTNFRNEVKWIFFKSDIAKRIFLSFFQCKRSLFITEKKVLYCLRPWTILLFAIAHKWSNAFFHGLLNIIRIKFYITKTCLFKYTENFTTKNKWKFSDKKFWYFSHFCSKHRLGVLFRTASARRF